MTDEVFIDCPQCGEKIAFYEAVDELKMCPECGTPKDTLFDIAMGDGVEAADKVAVADGGERQ